MGPISHFLGIKFHWKDLPNGHLTVNLNQEAFIDNILEIASIDPNTSSHPPTPYQSGLPVDAIVDDPPSDPAIASPLEYKYQCIFGCINWLSTSTRPEISTITNMLAQYQSKVSHQHLKAARYAVHYLSGTRTRGISFSSLPSSTLSSYVKFPITHLTGLCYANWGPQDQSHTRKLKSQPRTELDPFVSRSISGYLVYFNGPIQWRSKRQRITARSSAESEIYATDELTKSLQHIHHILSDIKVTKTYCPKSIPIFNDNMAAVC